MLLWNVRSINNKVDFVMQYIIDADVSVACITESWLTDLNNYITFRIKSYGFSISHKPRESGKGGGVCFIYKPEIKVIESKSKRTYESFEYHDLEICAPACENNIIVLCIYRKQEISFTQFHVEFTNFCESFIEQSLKSFFVMGDFNVHYESNSSFSNQLKEILSTYGLTQHVETATHKSGHMLDLLFSNQYEIPVNNICIDHFITENTSVKFDHFPIRFKTEFNSLENSVQYTVKDVRNIESIDIAEFDELYLLPICNDIMSNFSSCDFKTCVLKLNDSLSNALDTVSPVSRKRYRNNPKHFSVNWVDSEYRLARNKRRKLERAVKKSPTNVLKKNSYIQQKLHCSRLAKQKMSIALSTLVNDRNNKDDLFNILNGILDNTSGKCLPECDDHFLLANRFNNYYLSKIENIRSSIPCSSFIVSNDIIQTHYEPFDTFDPVTTDDLRTILRDMGKIKTSPIDPLPGKLLTKCIETILPMLVFIVNKSLSEGSVEGLKHSVITPIYKKTEFGS